MRPIVESFNGFNYECPLCKSSVILASYEEMAGAVRDKAICEKCGESQAEPSPAPQGDKP